VAQLKQSAASIGAACAFLNRKGVFIVRGALFTFGGPLPSPEQGARKRHCTAVEMERDRAKETKAAKAGLQSHCFSILCRANKMPVAGPY